ncbi:hypothetical protein FE236_00545 [Mariprofundus erugo]|nr:hypothetical protein FE236_00545 [Mariprofundus erugo]
MSSKPHLAPLTPEDTEDQTFGCRHSNPSICAKHSMPSVCAFARADNICLSPPRSWKQLRTRLLEELQAGTGQDKA